MTEGADWKVWRRDERQRLLQLRNSLPSATRRDLGQRVLANLDRELGTRRCAVLGIYWPIKREIDILGWASALSQRQAVTLALPVVTEPAAPLEYWDWRPGAPVTRGVWNIPVPVERSVVVPDLVIAPLVGFHACWRLGYGGGYFDRTLAANIPRPAALGIGYDILELDCFSPQPHDLPMQAVITESRVISSRN